MLFRHALTFVSAFFNGILLISLLHIPVTPPMGIELWVTLSFGLMAIIRERYRSVAYFSGGVPRSGAFKSCTISYW